MGSIITTINLLTHAAVLFLYNSIKFVFSMLETHFKGSTGSVLPSYQYQSKMLAFLFSCFVSECKN